MIKFNKIPILLVICTLIITCALGVFMLFNRDNKGQLMSFDNIIEVNIYGTEGEGYVDIQYNEKYIKNYKTSDGTSLTKEQIQLEVSKSNNLYNDDVFTITISNMSDLKDKGINFNKESESYKVSGLKIGTEFDVFKDFKIYIDEGDVMLDNNDCSNFVKDNVIFFIKNKLDSYKEGDNVIVGVYIDMNAATDNGYNIKELEKEYVLIEQENNQWLIIY